MIRGDSNGSSAACWRATRGSESSVLPPRVGGTLFQRRLRSLRTNLANNLHPHLLNRWAWNDRLQASFGFLLQRLRPATWCVKLGPHSPVTRTSERHISFALLIPSHYSISIRSSDASLQNSASQSPYPRWPHLERSRPATFRTLFLTMDSTANTCSPIADSSISARPSVPPGSRRPLPRASVDGLPQRCFGPVSRTISPQFRQPWSTDTSSCLSSCPLWLYKICDTSARRGARPSSLCARSLKWSVRATGCHITPGTVWMDTKAPKSLALRKNQTVLCWNWTKKAPLL